jgi:hypothetical protein
MACRKCTTKAGQNNVPSFVVPFDPNVEHINKYATMYFNITMTLTYGQSHQRVQSGSFFKLPYPLILALMNTTPRPVSFWKPNEEQAFRETYNL